MLVVLLLLLLLSHPSTTPAHAQPELPHGLHVLMVGCVSTAAQRRGPTASDTACQSDPPRSQPTSPQITTQDTCNSSRRATPFKTANTKSTNPIAHSSSNIIVFGPRRPWRGDRPRTYRPSPHTISTRRCPMRLRATVPTSTQHVL